ncbi:hypothetical protein JAAARDRAFT_196547 [Jaapia argillacea MUCL 33604]|uniref:Nephrocystin 3-like N-terminal domain-containing protein n=1 Tax=Jaapia argillacea MUCL 33604 TaxID=933084 RepID=A0A067PIM7_9AGAM|nr:hypothetical protein JAAARDRAFT_196547 [Jaapia argillacea MUCL 33604]
MATPVVGDTVPGTRQSDVRLFVNKISAFGLKHNRKHSVKATVGREIKTSRATERTKDPSWLDLDFVFDLSESSHLTVEVFDHPIVSLGPSFVGGIMVDSNVLRHETVITRQLDSLRRPGVDVAGSLTLHITVNGLGDTTGLDTVLEHAEKGLHLLDPPGWATPIPDPVSNVASSIAAVSQSTTDIWQPALNSVESFVEGLKASVRVVDALAEIHPYAKATWTLLSFVYKTVINQIALDARINHLAHVIREIYQVAIDADPLKNHGTIGKTLQRMLMQTSECAYFIREYAKTKGFASRAVKNQIDPVDDKIDVFETKFNALKSDLELKATIQSSIAVFRILDTVAKIEETLVLNDLPYASASYKIKLGCLPGSRQEILEEIVDWVNDARGDSTQSRIFLVTGVAGSGKSAIAHTIARHFSDQERLGSSLFFKRGTTDRPETLFSTIARDLADSNSQFCHELLAAVGGSRSLIQTNCVQRQFQSFILTPTQNLKTVGPVVVVIDALDECKDYEDILHILATDLDKLPPNLRILVTARAEDAICAKFEKSPYTCHKRMEEISRKSTSEDISSFVDRELSDVVESLERRWPNGRWRKELVSKADGLFQWAYTACRFIRQGGRGNGPARRFEIITSGGSVLKDLDALYLEVLRHSFPALDDEFLDSFRFVIGAVIVARTPLSIQSLDALLHTGPTNYSSPQDVLRPLGSLFSGVSNDASPVQVLHTSFRDFIAHTSQSDKFAIDIVLSNGVVARSCLETMISGLRQNICHFNDRFTVFSDLSPEELSRIRSEFLSEALQYACRFWASHLSTVATDTSCYLPWVEKFLRLHLLSWMEVMSILQKLDEAVSSLLDLGTWLLSHAAQDPYLHTMAFDATRFIRNFFLPISSGPLQVYTSALPLVPTETTIHTNYSRLVHNTAPFVLHGRERRWSPLLFPLDGHEQPISALAFSSDGARLVSGDVDGNVHMWSLDTGALAGSTIRVKHSEVVSVMFTSGDSNLLTVCGERFATLPKLTEGPSHTSQERIQLWCADTGAEIPLVWQQTALDPPIAHTTDGVHIATLDNSNSPALLFPADGVPLRMEFDDNDNGPNILKVALNSNEGELVIAVAFDDGLIHVLPGESGLFSRPRLVNKSRAISALSVSCDGSRLACGFVDGNLQLWDLTEEDPFGTCARGQDDMVTALVFSPDSVRLFSGYENGVIVVWEFGPNGTGGFREDIVSKEQGASISSLVFVDLGKQLAIGSSDGSVCIWDVANRRIARQLPASGTDRACSMAFSTDGNLVAICTEGGMLTLWKITPGVVCWDTFVGQENGNRTKLFFIQNDTKLVTCHTKHDVLTIRDSSNGAVLHQDFPLFEDPNHALGETNVVPVPGSSNIVQLGMTAKGGYMISGHVWECSELPTISRVWQPQFSPSTSWSPDHSMLVYSDSCLPVMTLVLYNLPEHTVQILSGHSGWPRIRAFYPDRMLLASGDHQGCVRVWQAPENLTYPVGCGDSTQGSPSVARGHLSPDGSIMVVCKSSTTEYSLQFFDPHNRRPVGDHFSTPAHLTESEFAFARERAAFFPNSSRLLVDFNDDSPLLVASPSNQPLRLQRSGGSITALTFSRDSSRLVMESFNGVVRVWDTFTGRCLRESHIQFHQGEATYDNLRLLDGEVVGVESVVDHESLGPEGTLQFSSDQSKLISVRSAGHIRVWYGSSGDTITQDVLKHIPKEENSNGVILLAISSDGSLFAMLESRTTITNDTMSLGALLYIWETTNGTIVNEKDLDMDVISASFSSDASTMAFCSPEEGCFIWNFADGSVRLISGERGNKATLFSTDAKRVAMIDEAVDVSVRQPRIQIWDLEESSMIYDQFVPHTILEGIEDYDKSPLQALIEGRPPGIGDEGASAKPVSHTSNSSTPKVVQAPPSPRLAAQAIASVLWFCPVLLSIPTFLKALPGIHPTCRWWQMVSLLMYTFSQPTLK